MTDTTRSSQYSVGDTVSLDGIECLIVYAAETKQDWGRYVLVDKNHDLCWYFDGTDYQDESESHDVINNANKYGYEWGGYETSTGIAGLSIGSGLANTNSLIGMNLQPSTDGWFVLWNKVNEFRSSRSSKWFVPSMDELDLVYENRDNLSGLTTIDNNSIPYSLPYYWSSSESSSTGAWVKNFDSSYFLNRSKYNHWFRTRLCRYATDADLNPSQTTPIEITCETEGADIRYTLDGSDPTEESTLYSGQFEVTPPVTIKARGYKEGMLASDVAGYEVEAPLEKLPTPVFQNIRPSGNKSYAFDIVISGITNLTESNFHFTENGVSVSSRWGAMTASDGDTYTFTMNDAYAGFPALTVYVSAEGYLDSDVATYEGGV